MTSRDTNQPSAKMVANAQVTTIADGEDARHADPPEQNQRPSENETQQDGKCEREKHVAPEIEGGDDEPCDKQAL